MRYALEGSGYLKRKPDPSDARAVLFTLTARGAALKEKLSRSITILGKNGSTLWAGSGMTSQDHASGVSNACWGEACRI